jgi:hypothetical protein
MSGFEVLEVKIKMNAANTELRLLLTSRLRCATRAFLCQSRILRIHHLFPDFLNGRIRSKSLEQALSDLSCSDNLPWEGEQAMYHAEMYEMAERFQIPQLQQQAYQCFVRLFATQQGTQSDAEHCRRSNFFRVLDFRHLAHNRYLRDSDVDTESESGEPANKTLLYPEVDFFKINDTVSAIMSHELVSLMKPIVDILVRGLLAIRSRKPRPPTAIDRSYRLLKDQLLFARLEDVGEKCAECSSKLHGMQGCEHGWNCDQLGCNKKCVAPSFCDVFLEFIDESLELHEMHSE